MKIKDGDWELFSYDYQTGRQVWRLFDGREEHWRTSYPVDAVMKANAEQRNAHGGAKWGGGRRVASIPLNTFFDENLGLAKAHEQDDKAFLSRWLNDSDNQAFRTFEGRV